jgi:CubicO group peptidase (beta-lactamase class C family)
MSILDTLTERLTASLAKHNLPGAAIAVQWKGRLYEAAAGVTHTSTGVPVTPDAVFPFGSITKTLNATLALRLVDQGKLDLDAPARTYVPEFDPVDKRLADITVRQLLTHTSGLVGTLFNDTGRNEDALARQIELINAHPMAHPPGALLSYCNSGMLLLGRCIETASGQPWDIALRTLLAEPLGLDALVARPEFALRHRFAAGHVRMPGSPDWVVDPHPFLLHGHSPAGSTPAGRARDLVAMANAYLHGDLLKPDTVDAAWSVQFPASYPGRCSTGAARPSSATTAPPPAPAPT